MKLVDLDAVQALLSENTSKFAQYFVVFTQHGTLLAHSRPSAKCDLVRYTAYAGAVWRNHVARIAATGTTDLNIGGLPEIKTLAFRLRRGPQVQLDQLTVELDGLTTVIMEVRPRLLVAAQMDTAERNGHRVARTREAMKTENDDDGNSESTDDSNRVQIAEAIESEDKDKDAQSDDQDGDADDFEASVNDEDWREDDEKRSEDSKESSADSDSETAARRSKHSRGKPKLDRLRILELKAEGMAEALALDFPAQLPRDFY